MKAHKAATFICGWNDRFSYVIWFVGLLMLVYVVALFRAMYLWSAKDPNAQSLPSGLAVTVIVPFRNEERHLMALVKSLAAQQYAQLELIFVNDHSDDQSVTLLERLLPELPFDAKILNLKQAEGKKAAIDLGVRQANGDIILTTDADCVFGPVWVEEMVRPFAVEKVQMVSGPVALEGKGLFQRWQQMEFASLIALGGAMIRSGKPGMANGANLAYRRQAFLHVNGFEGISQTPSGDDELLLMKICDAYHDGVVFRKSSSAVVTTEAQKNWSALKQQRLRWASKWKVGKRPATSFTAIFIFLLNLSWFLLPFAIVAGLANSDDALLVYNIRFIIEAIWVMVLTRFFPNTLSVRALILHQFLYPLYVIYFGLMANFGNYKWKDRSYAIRVQ